MKVKLGSLYKISSGGTPLKKNKEYYDDGDINWVKTGDLKQQYLFDTQDCITQIGLEKSSAKMYEENTVLVAMYGATIGATSILKIPACTNQACAAFPKIDKVIPEYLYYFLKSKKKQFVKDGVGGAQPNISASYLKNVDFILMEVKEQKKIVETLDKTGRLIELKRQQIQEFDTLIKSRFVEMFGDPVHNPLGWDVKPLLDCGDCKNGMNFSADESGLELKYLGVGDFQNLTVIDDVLRLGNVSLNKMPKDDHILKDGDIVFVRSNGNKKLVGRCLAVYPNNIPTTFSGFCIRYRNTDKSVEIPYLLQVLKTDSMRLNLLGRGANIQNLNQKILAELMIPVPPNDLQIRFSQCMSQVEKLKNEVQKSLDETQILFDSLMQEYFE
jgi:type I restriction enzyme S subunit